MMQLACGCLKNLDMSYRLREYTVAKQCFNLVVEVSGFTAFMFKMLAHCDFHLGHYETALEQATVSLSFLTGDNILTVYDRKRVQNLIEKIEKAMSDKELLTRPKNKLLPAVPDMSNMGG